MGLHRYHEMEKQKRYSRKSFIRWIGVLSLGFGAWLFYRLTSFQTEREGNLEFRHDQDISLGISYFGRYYIVRTENSFRAFSTTCTHAGCRIGIGNGSTLQCGCHGSQFDAETGKPIKGPAIKPLKELECVMDTKNGQWVLRFKT